MQHAALEILNNNYIFRCSFTDRTLAIAAGFKWNSTAKIWYTHNPAVAIRLIDYGTDELKNKLKTALSAKTIPLSLPLPPKGLKLLDHQIEAVKFSLARNKSYLGLDPGLGKTIVAATIAQTLNQPVVYISPPFLVENVRAEFKKWAPDLYLHIIPDSKLTRSSFDIAPIINRLFKKPILFIDEAHRFKNDHAKRTINLFERITPFFDRQIFMSGTPVPNRPIELFAVLKNAAPETIDNMSRFQYGRRFCAGYRGKWGWDFTGASNLKELNQRVVGTFMLRQRKRLLNLPPKTEELFIVSSDMSVRLAGMESRIGDTYKNIEDLVKARLTGKEEGTHIASYRRLLGIEKVKAIAPYIKSLIEDTDESVLVFAYHKDVISALKTALIDLKPLIITGETPTAKRGDIVKIFQNTKRRLLIGNYLAAGIGFTLTKATRVIMVEFDWVPGNNDQASDRAHRIGQEKPVLVQYVVYKDSLDKLVLETLFRKRRHIKQI